MLKKSGIDRWGSDEHEAESVIAQMEREYDTSFERSGGAPCRGIYVKSIVSTVAFPLLTLERDHH